MKSKGLTPERLARIKQIITEQKEKETMQSTWEKFQKELKTQTREELHLAMIEDFSNVIAKHFPNFDNNISDDTWGFLELFTEETIYQLTDPALNCECGYQH
jgi:hypothetical protein